MEESNIQFDGNLKENYQLLSKNPIIRNVDENIFPNRNKTPLKKLNDNFVTPSRNNGLSKCHTPGTPFTQTPTHDPMVETPNGSKISHPFLSSIIRNLDKSVMSPNFFMIGEKSTKDSNVLSPDLAGILFPADIDVDADTQYNFEADLFKKYEKYCNKKSDLFFQKGTIAPSPDNYDSGVGASLQTSNDPSMIESDRGSIGPLSLLVHNTPPSKYKWNREEYRLRNPSVIANINLSFESEDESMDFFANKCNLESTKILDNSIELAFNLSMRNHSIIESAMFDSDNEEMEPSGNGQRVEFRSSPNGGFSSSAMDDLAISPIRSDRRMEGSGDEEF